MKAQLTTLPPDLVSLADYARLAADFIDPMVWAWLEGVSGDGEAARANMASYANYAIYNRLLVDCRTGSTRMRLFGQDLAHPILLAPIGYQRMLHPEGEIASARGCLDTVHIISSFASCPLEDISHAAAGPTWFQLYFQPEREQTEALVRRAERAGYSAIMVTLDVPVKPSSRAAQQAGFALPPGVEAVNLHGYEPVQPIVVPPGESMILRGMMSYAPRIEDIRWLRDLTGLPIIAKGVTHPDDARMLIEAGCDGLVVSNHGGRALEAAPAPLDQLPAIRAALGPDVPLLIDGAIRSGSDIFKALALGANAVMVGRPFMYALAVAGSLGIAHMIKLLREDLELAMALAGCPDIASITHAALVKRRGEGATC
jgi:4-hydroxymandelate oxidase